MANLGKDLVATWHPSRPNESFHARRLAGSETTGNHTRTSNQRVRSASAFGQTAERTKAVAVPVHSGISLCCTCAQYCAIGASRRTINPAAISIAIAASIALVAVERGSAAYAGAIGQRTVSSDLRVEASDSNICIWSWLDTTKHP